MAQPKRIEIDQQVVGEAVYEAMINLMNAVGGYPVTRDDIIDAMGRGTERAVAEYLRVHGLPGGAK